MMNDHIVLELSDGEIENRRGERNYQGTELLPCRISSSAIWVKLGRSRQIG